MPFRYRYLGQCVREVRPHAVPAQVDAGIVFKIPVQSCSSIYRAVGGDDYTVVAALCQFKIRFSGRGVNFYEKMLLGISAR